MPSEQITKSMRQVWALIENGHVHDGETLAQAALAAQRALGLVLVSAEVVEDLCSELEAEVKDRWGYDERLAHKLERDMATVVKVRAMIAAAQGGE
jgi:hypothetical protein